jgi:hypothetical protein
MPPTPDPQRGYLSYGVEKTSSLTDIHGDVEHLAGEKEGEDLVDERVSLYDLLFSTLWQSDQ